jgi:hypothetical protein
MEWQSYTVTLTADRPGLNLGGLLGRTHIAEWMKG